MKIGITYRLFLSILAATCLTVLCMFFIMEWSINRGFLQYVKSQNPARLEQMSGTLQQAYAEHGGWGFLRDDPHFWTRRLLDVMFHEASSRRGMKPPEVERHPPPFLRPPPDGGRPKTPFIVLDKGRNVIFGNPKDSKGASYRPIIHDNQTVGYVGLLSPEDVLNPQQLRFLGRQKTALILSASGMVLLVIIFSLPLARRLVRPIRAIAEATRELASGRYSARARVLSSDELGQLARDFNAMALILEKNEKARRQWIADISHELRTPLAVLRGEIEALLEGIRSTTPEAIRSLHSEALRLHRLVDDLYQLALSDLGTLTYRKEDLDLTELLREAIETYRPEFALKNIALTSTLQINQEVKVFADPERLHQLFANLFDNSLKYTDREGTLLIRLTRKNTEAVIEFEDSAPGVPETELSKLFDRLFRVEASRNRSSGGAGLGLAICRNIVEAHEGKISAHPSPSGGLGIRVVLPLSEGRL